MDLLDVLETYGNMFIGTGFYKLVNGRIYCNDLDVTFMKHDPMRQWGNGWIFA